MSRVAIIHPWFPQYRVEFFEQLIELSAGHGIEVCVFHGDPPPEWGERGDSVRRPWAQRLSSRFFRVRKRSLVYKDLKEYRHAGPYDLTIVEHAVRNLETYKLLWFKKHNVAFWGHGRTYTQPQSRFQERFKSAILGRASWFFAYTQGGGDAVAEAGFDPTRITVVQNAIDSAQLAKIVAAQTFQDDENMRAEFDAAGPVALFLGGLDASKRLNFLFSAAKQVHQLLPEFKLVIAGDGQSRPIVEAWCAEHAWIKYAGPAHGERKAALLSMADILAMPGRVGLVAVDSFASETPIITTNWPYHAPEFEYLVNGVNAVVTADDRASFVTELLAIFKDSARRRSLEDGCKASRQVFTVENMVANFQAGIVGALDSKGIQSS
ncbi:glycosyltransferase family 4 protein [Arthrobacter sp. AOP36-C1-22]|uniref:glycosyltransferase family 4 protein n=1 Tax=Arthrobacter sp. AOP36-C1-22 TaxID=3457683 RepID=UPI0040335543